MAAKVSPDSSLVEIEHQEEKHGRAMMSGGRVIDFVFMYSKDKSDQEKELMRNSFEENLEDFGIELEREETDEMVFVLLHCPWDTLCRGAQAVKLRKPVGEKSLQPTTSDRWMGCIKRNEVKFHVHQPFSLKDRESFLIHDKDSFFSGSERSFILFNILEKTVFKADDKIHTGIDVLLDEKVYNAVYPLHDPLPDKPSNDLRVMNEREILLRTWASKKNLFRNQPLSRIRTYFGEQYAFYFAFLGMYIAFLSVAAIIGLGVTLYGFISLRTDSLILDKTCDRFKAPGNFTLCPKCDRTCNYSSLFELCVFARITQVFDNKATLAFSFFVCVWAICFCELWKRRQFFLQYLWSVNDFESHESKRPEYNKQATKRVVNPFTGVEEPYMPPRELCLRRFISLSMVFLLLVIVLITIIAVLIYRLAISYAFYQSKILHIKKNAKLLTTITAAIINVIFIVIFSKIYMTLARVLTDIEAHKTNSSYQDSFIFKNVIFQFINNYGSLIYIAFFKGSFVDSPGYNGMYMFGAYKQDECEVIGCMWELSVQLMIIMILKQAINAVAEMSIPILKKAFKGRSNKSPVEARTAWGNDYILQPLEIVPLYTEYIEMVVQYGFVVLFVSAFPLAPLFAFINNLFELRMDAYKLLKLSRRPPGLKSQDIGAWQGTLETFSHIALLSNAFILAWTSDLIPRLVYSFKNGGDMGNFLEFTLQPYNTSVFLPSQRPDPLLFPESLNVTECRYRSYATPSEQVAEGAYLAFYWQVLCARWAFVIVFEHACVLVISLFKMIPDKSDSVKLIQEYERTIHSQVTLNDLFERVKCKRLDMNAITPFLTKHAANTLANLSQE